MNRSFLFLTPLLIVTLTSCGGSGAPSCSDSDVTSTAVELLTKGLPLQNLHERAAHSDCLNQAMGTFGLTDFENFDTLKVADPCVNRELDATRAYVAKVRSRGFENIRTAARDDGLRKVACLADMDEYHNIQYSAQYTDEGKVYVSVY